jgi:hypothetical protein
MKRQTKRFLNWKRKQKHPDIFKLFNVDDLTPKRMLVREIDMPGCVIDGIEYPPTKIQGIEFNSNI